MSLLDKASLIITPNAEKVGKLYSVIPSDGSGDLTVVRGTTATRVNSLGLVENVAVNEPRFNYETVGGCPAILIEPQRMNRLLNSETVVTQTISTTGVACTVSFYGTGTITFSGTFTGSLVGTGANNRVILTFTPTTGSLILTVTGSVTKGQLETGNYATSYIPTLGSAQTRNADTISKTVANTLIGQTQGTVFAHFKFTNVGIEKYIILINDASTVNQISIRRMVGGELRAVFGATTVSGTTNASSAILPNGTYKIAYKYISGSLKLFINGALSFSLTPTFTFGSLLDNIRIGNDAGTTMPLGDSITSIQLYKTALTDQECINLTTL
jgi:hypothetical protein